MLGARPATTKDGRPFVVRPARPDDAEAWIANVQAVADERVYVMTEVFARTVDQVRAQFQQVDPAQALWLVAELDRTVVGEANFLRGPERKRFHTAALGMSVPRPYRGLGIGEAILRYGIDWARSIGVEKLVLDVFATNRAAIGLYAKLGFREEARLPDAVRLDGAPVALVAMALPLAPPGESVSRRS